MTVEVNGLGCRSARCEAFCTSVDMWGVKTHARYVRSELRSLEEMIGEGERLSRACGVNPGTVSKKVPPCDKGKSLLDATFQKWDAAEELNLKTNIRFGIGCLHSWSTWSSQLECVRCPDDIDEVALLGLRRVFQAILGTYRKGKPCIKFGPGVAVVDPRGVTDSSRLVKLGAFWMRSNPQFVGTAYLEAKHWPLVFADAALPGYEGFNTPLVAAKQIQVPKTNSINRTITVGLPAQISAQFQVDSGIRASLRRVGVDLDKVANLNRLKAYVGSVTGHIATLDMSSASDLISVGLLAYLCKGNSHTEELFKDVMCTRSAFLRGADGHHYWVQGVDGMGNPAVFSLESAIFLAVNLWFFTWSAYGPREPAYVSVGKPTFHWLGKDWPVALFASFGDDQAPPEGPPIEDWGRVYALLGMQVNVDKSFGLHIDSWPTFRESCGADFDDGRYVRGFYLKTRRPTLRDAVRLYNFFTIHYGASEDLKRSKLYAWVKKKTCGAWLDPKLYKVSTSAKFWEIRVPEDFLLVHGCEGRPKRGLRFSAGSHKGLRRFYLAYEHPCEEWDFVYAALEGSDDEVSFWHDLDQDEKPFMATPAISELAWESFLSSNSRDLSFGLVTDFCEEAITKETMELSTMYLTPPEGKVSLFLGSS